MPKIKRIKNILDNLTIDDLAGANLLEQQKFSTDYAYRQEQLAQVLINDLLLICRRYKNYLENFLINQLAAVNIEVAKMAMVCVPIFKTNNIVVTGPRGIEYLAREMADNQRKDYIESALAKKTVAQTAIKQYKKITELSNILEATNSLRQTATNAPSAILRLNCFYQQFFPARALLSQTLDSFLLRLIKCICRIVTFGYGLPCVNKMGEGESTVALITKCGFWQAAGSKTFYTPMLAAPQRPLYRGSA